MSSILPDINEANKPYKLEIPGHGTLTGYTFNSHLTGQPSTVRFAQVPYTLPVEAADRFKIAKPIPDDYDYTGDYGKVGLKCPQPAVDNPIFQYSKSPSQEAVQYVNIFTPLSTEDMPEGGWPVLVYLHGGWLQYNSANHVFLDTANFNSEFQKKFILVTVGYRLNMFGFLSCKELLKEDPKASNFGFWDQRMAIEWTAKYIKYFNGNPDKITVGGISAGSYSTFFQLAYELYHPEAPKIIKQALFQSNLVYCQPKTIEETQAQFDEIISKLGIDTNATSAEKLAKLRSIPASEIEDFIPTLKMHTFRAVTDEYFVSSKIIKELYDGGFAAKLKERNIRVLTGEVDNEPWKYSILNTPKSIKDLDVQVENYYPANVIKPLLEKYSDDISKLDEEDPEFNEKMRLVFGDITSDGQVHASERGFINKVHSFGFPKELIYRYRISYRADWLDSILPKEFKVIHGFDFSLWFFAVKDYKPEEVEVAKKWLKPFLNFLSMDKEIEGWDNSDVKKYNFLNENGEISYEDDQFWDRGVEIAEAVYKAQI